MAVLEMPASGVAQQRFEVDRVDYESPTTGGRTGNVTAGFPRWEAEYGVGRAGELNSDAWRAFLDRLHGGKNLFFGRDVNRPYPRAHAGGFDGMTRAGGGAFDGSAGGWSLDGTRTVLSLTGLPAGLALNLADYGDFRWDTGGWKRSLHRFVTAAVANGSGALTVEVYPPVPTLVQGGTTFSLDRPCCLMKRRPETKVGSMDRRKSVEATLVARQELIA